MTVDQVLAELEKFAQTLRDVFGLQVSVSHVPEQNQATVSVTSSAGSTASATVPASAVPAAPAGAPASSEPAAHAAPDATPTEAASVAGQPPA